MIEWIIISVLIIWVIILTLQVQYLMRRKDGLRLMIDDIWRELYKKDKRL